MKKITLNENYSSNGELRDFIAHIDERFEEGELVQRNKRNTLRRFTFGGVKAVVKHFGVPNPFNRIIYSLVRKPKGLRAYEYSFRVRKAGFDTPEAMAYVEKRKRGIVADSYFVSAECPYKRRFYEFGNAAKGDYEEIIRTFARRAAALHEAGILHRDFSPGNILFDRVGGAWKFAIVDINRMSFRPISVKDGCRNFARLWGPLELFRVIADEYSKARCADAGYCFQEIRKARKKFWKRFSRRHKVSFPLEY